MVGAHTHTAAAVAVCEIHRIHIFCPHLLLSIFLFFIAQNEAYNVCYFLLCLYALLYDIKRIYGKYIFLSVLEHPINIVSIAKGGGGGVLRGEILFEQQKERKHI